MNKAELLDRCVEQERSLERYSSEQLTEFLSGEWDEYLEARNEALIGGSPLNLAQEGWDVIRYIKALRARDDFRPDSMNDYMYQALEGQVLHDFELTGIDWVEAGLMKETKNRRKYATDPMSLNGHTPLEYHSINREAWKLQDGDLHFYHMYMMLADRMFPDDE